jgi:CheY-like chemotaxis protein
MRHFPAASLFLGCDADHRGAVRLREILRCLGFGVVGAANATEAVRILEARPDIYIVFSDIDMPAGLDGMKLAALIRDRWPPIEIILVSGYGHPPKVELPARTVFFPKPYKESEIIAQIRKFAA